MARAKTQRTRPEQAAAAALSAARKEFRALDETWVRWPIDVELVAGLLYNLGVKRVPGLTAGGQEYSGVLFADQGLIAVEASHHEHRQRFTIAHEIGHFVLHYAGGAGAAFYGDLPQNFDVTDAGRGEHLRREAEANAFAAELLMPLEMVDAMYAVEKGDVLRLARHFHVSPEAMERRLARLGLPPKKRRPWGRD